MGLLLMRRGLRLGFCMVRFVVRFVFGRSAACASCSCQRLALSCSGRPFSVRERLGMQRRLCGRWPARLEFRRSRDVLVFLAIIFAFWRRCAWTRFVRLQKCDWRAVWHYHAAPAAAVLLVIQASGTRAGAGPILRPYRSGRRATIGRARGVLLRVCATCT